MFSNVKKELNLFEIKSKNERIALYCNKIFYCNILLQY